MRTLIFCTSYIDDTIPSCHRDRYAKWIRYYADKLDRFGATQLFLVDDGTALADPLANAAVLDADNLPAELGHTVNFVSFGKHLGRPMWKDYRGWWRSFLFSVQLAEKYDFDKIIHIESDFFIVSSRMMDYIRNLASGWTAFYSPYYEFAESAIQVICRDEFDGLKKMYDEASAKNFFMNLAVAEKVLPFTHVAKEYYGDRLGELEVMDGWLSKVKTPLGLDFIGQVHPGQEASDYESFFQFEHRF